VRIGNSPAAVIPDIVFGTVPLFSFEEGEGAKNRGKSENLPMRIDFAACGAQDANHSMYITFLSSFAAKSIFNEQ